MAETFTLKPSVSISLVDCVVCGIVFGVPEIFERGRRDDHGSFCCPSGHSLSYLDKSEAERLRERLKAATDRADALAKELAARPKPRTTRKPKVPADG